MADEILHNLYNNLASLIPDLCELKHGKSYILSNDSGNTGINFYRLINGYSQNEIGLSITEYSKQHWKWNRVLDEPIHKSFHVIIFPERNIAQAVSVRGEKTDSYKMVYDFSGKILLNEVDKNSPEVNAQLNNWLNKLLQEGYKPIAISELLEKEPKTMLSAFFSHVNLPNVGKKVDEFFSFLKR